MALINSLDSSVGVGRRQPIDDQSWDHWQYLARIYEEVKGRPRYVITQSIEGEVDKSPEKKVS